MCGIIIQLSFGKNLPEANLLKRMLSEIQHRGPDSSGTLIKGWVGLGFNRLSIIIIILFKFHLILIRKKKIIIIICIIIL